MLCEDTTLLVLHQLDVDYTRAAAAVCRQWNNLIIERFGHDTLLDPMIVDADFSECVDDYFEACFMFELRLAWSVIYRGFGVLTRLEQRRNGLVARLGGLQGLCHFQCDNDHFVLLFQRCAAVCDTDGIVRQWLDWRHYPDTVRAVKVGATHSHVYVGMEVARVDDLTGELDLHYPILVQWLIV